MSTSRLQTAKALPLVRPLSRLIRTTTQRVDHVLTPDLTMETGLAIPEGQCFGFGQSIGPLGHGPRPKTM